MGEMISKFFGGIVDFFAGIVNFIFGGIANIILSFISSFGLTIEIPANVFDILREISIGVGYIIPVRALLPIPIFMITFYTLKLIFSIYQLIAGTIIKRVHFQV